MKKLMKALGGAFRALLLIAGFGGIAWGVWLIYAPAGVIAGGLALAGLALLLYAGTEPEETEKNKKER